MEGVPVKAVERWDGGGLDSSGNGEERSPRYIIILNYMDPLFLRGIQYNRCVCVVNVKTGFVLKYAIASRTHI